MLSGHTPKGKNMTTLNDVLKVIIGAWLIWLSLKFFPGTPSVLSPLFLIGLAVAAAGATLALASLGNLRDRLLGSSA
jgi:hypothetical protein